MDEKMLAIMKTKPAYGAELVEVDVPKPGPGEVLIRVLATTICGTDLHIYEWNEWAQSRIKTPQIMGHEVAGEVVEVGQGVDNLEVGDYISAETHIVCGKCYQCRTGNYHVCQNTKIFGVDMDGVFAEYAIVPAQNAWKNPKGMPLEYASLQEPLGNAVDTVLAGPIAGKSTLITGAGPLGLLGITVAKASGAYPVIVSEPSEFRRKLAEKVGADYIINPFEEDVVKEVRDITDGNGVDVFLEFSGAPKALEQGLQVVTPGGRVSLLGLFPRDVTVDFNNLIIFKSLTIHGITGRHLWNTWYTVSRLIQSGKLNLEPVLTHRYKGFDKFEEAFELMRAGKTGKVVFFPQKA
ncbi:L-threonine 3-dehydrogenase [Thermococcus sp.]